MSDINFSLGERVKGIGAYEMIITGFLTDSQQLTTEATDWVLLSRNKDGTISQVIAHKSLISKLNRGKSNLSAVTSGMP